MPVPAFPESNTGAGYVSINIENSIYGEIDSLIDFNNILIEYPIIDNTNINQIIEM